MRLIRSASACALLAAASAIHSQAALITFTGGVVTRLDATTQTTNNSVLWDNVDYYDEGGFRLDFLPNTAGGVSAFVGNYYGASNDVIHSHWLSGGIGGVTLMRITKNAPGTFDLNYFTLTSNTDQGGGPASGLEEAWVQGFVGGLPTGPAVRLPSEDWGFPATVVGLGSNFDAVDRVDFFTTNVVDCFGMDDFYIDQVPEPSSALLMLMLGGVVAARARSRG